MIIILQFVMNGVKKLSNHLLCKGYMMDYKLNKELLSYAVKMGCKTAADFALFLKARESILAL